MIKFATLISSALTLFLVCSCGGSKATKSNSDADFPQRVGSGGDATALTSVGTFSLSDAALSPSLTMDLSRAYHPGEAGLSACFQLPADSVPVGRAECASDAKISAEILAANINFTCVGNADFDTRPAKSGLSLANCSELKLFAYEFRPKLTLVLDTAK